MISFLVDSKTVAATLMQKVWQIQNTYMKQAMNAASKVIENEYRNTLRTMPPMRGRLGNPSFEIAWMTVARKVKMFRDGNGVFSVIGHKTGLGGRSLSPQAWFAEEGTAKRKTKTGQNRGMMPAQHYLRIAVNRSLPIATDVFWGKLRELVNAGSSH